MISVKAVDLIIRCMAPKKEILKDKVQRFLFARHASSFAAGKFSTLYGWSYSTKKEYLEVLKKFGDLEDVVESRVNAYFATKFVDPLPAKHRHDILTEYKEITDRLERLHCPNCGHKINLEVTP